MDFSGVPQEGLVPPVGMVPPGGTVSPGLPQMSEEGAGSDDAAGQNGLAEHYDEDVYQQGEFVEVKNFMVDGGDRFGVSAVAFDGQEELLWMGNQGGHVTSYHGLDLHKYTSFQMHEMNEIRQMLTIDHNIYSLTSDSLRCWSKYGRPQFTYMSSATQDMQCMLVTGPGSILMGGHQPLVVELDIESHTEIRQVQVGDPGCAIFRYSSQYICTGDTSGKVTLRDPKSLRAEHVFQAHSGTLSDFDVHANQLVTCGFVKRMGNLTCDRFLTVYDLRLLRPMTPMQVMIDPLFLRFVPTYSNRICVVSQTGQFQVLEQGMMQPESVMTYQAQTEGTHITSFDMSPSNQVMSFGDAGGFFHVFASSHDAVFSPYSIETEFPTVETVTPVSMMDELTPYAIIPMQYPQNGTLASDWPEKFSQSVYRKPIRLDPEILKSVKMVQNVGYAPNPNTRRRNQVAYKCSAVGNNPQRERTSSVPESPLGRGEDPFVSVPKTYRKVEIKYSKLGVEDFDFRHYNKTNFAGLETHIPNAYCNSMLQVLYFIEPLRCSLLAHICDKEFCLSCELSFLFHMLDGQKGKTCQASNFLRAFRTIPEASALGLVLGDAEESMGKANLPRLIQNWSRFIVQQIHAELVEARKVKAKQNVDEAASKEETGDQKEERAGAEEKPSGETEAEKQSVIRRLFGVYIENKFTCKCSESSVRETCCSLLDLAYPDTPSASRSHDKMANVLPKRLLSDALPGSVGSPRSEPPKQHTFASVVERSLSLEVNTQAWCTRCEKYQPHVQSKFVKSLPDILALNCHLENTQDAEFWRTQEQLHAKSAAEDPNHVSNAPLPARAFVKPCRYGEACTRKFCKFGHGDERDAQLEAPKPYLEEGVSEFAWVPLGLRLKLQSNGKVKLTNLSDEGEVLDDGENEGAVYYDLLATVTQIRDGSTSSLVSLVKVGETYHQRKEHVTCTQWYLFNDFAITPVEKQEPVSFNLDWKVPCVIYFARRNITKLYDLKVTTPITSEVLYATSSLVNTPRRLNMMFMPLDESERLTAGSVVGIDAEFVTLNQEEAELRSDGTRSTIKPSQMSVARISVVRGQGELMGEPFIDDYISTSEQVVDYLTQFSGIQPGDLDAAISSKHLTTLKLTYLKLRHLADSGVIFVGHGLKKDFRVINMIVPKDQVTDTVDLFHLPRQRRISLKFLAWYFLGINIQSTSHDSIEDARTALKLYRKYKSMASEGVDPQAAIKEMYDKGRALQWKIPEDDGEQSLTQGAVINKDII